MIKNGSGLIERIKAVAGQDFDSYSCRVRNPHITARQSIEIADYIVVLERERNELAARVERLRGIVVSYYTTGVCVSDVKNILAETQPAALTAIKAQWQAEVTNGDPLNLLPAIGSDVYFHLASSDSWEPYVVTGFSAWASLADGDCAYHRVFVRGLSKSGNYNSRLLKDVRLTMPGGR